MNETPRESHPLDQLPGYLLGESSREEAEAVEAHLRSCRACREERDRLEHAFVASVEGLPGPPPSEDAWAGIESRVWGHATAPTTDAAATAPESAPLGPSTRPDDELRGAPAEEAQPFGRAARAPEAARRARKGGGARWRERGSRPWASGFAAGLVLVVAVGGWGLWQRQEMLEVRAELRDARARVELLETEVGTIRARADDLVDDQARLARWLARNDVTVRRLPPEGEGEPFAQGSVLFAPEGRALVVMHASPGEGRDFQAWGVRGDAVTSLGVLEGRTLVVEADTFDAVAVSREPDGGSDTPTEVLGAAPAG
ncbi:MAG: anti-sigma factor [Trueperaceae bacterium]|nr:anti-sigma factor [Trueperaceae bacterium]